MKSLKLLICIILIIQLTTAFPWFFKNNQKALQNDSCTQSCCASLPARPMQRYTFYQNTGRFVGGSGEWAINTHAYSGQGDGYLNPAKQCVVDVGPLPATTYKLGYCVNVMHETTQRPCSFYLDPQKPS